MQGATGEVRSYKSKDDLHHTTDMSCLHDRTSSKDKKRGRGGREREGWKEGPGEGGEGGEERANTILGLDFEALCTPRSFSEARASDQTPPPPDGHGATATATDVTDRTSNRNTATF